VLTAQLLVNNTAGAGTANNVNIDSILTNNGVTVVSGTGPVVATLPGGSSAPFVATFQLPDCSTHFLADFRESAKDASGLTYSFDSVPLDRG
jgi:hypothetical protein